MRKLYEKAGKLLIALLLCLSCSAVSVLADKTIYTEGTLYYIIEDGSITITGCFGRDEEVTVPDNIAGIPVNVIGTGAFTDNEYVKTINLPGTITTIEEGAFKAGVNVVYDGVLIGSAQTDQSESQDSKGEDSQGEPVTDSNTSTGNSDSSDQGQNTEQTVDNQVTDYDASVLPDEENTDAEGSDTSDDSTDIGFDEIYAYWDDKSESESKKDSKKNGIIKYLVIFCGTAVIIAGYLIFRHKEQE